MTVSLPHEVRQGARCLVGGRFKATVQYLGPIDGQAGDWVGLEWDDASRGKHDGSHGGRRYFSCRDGAQAGSFVRLPKFLEAVSLGCTLLEAIQRRYGGGDHLGTNSSVEQGEKEDVQPEELGTTTGRGSRVEVELVGAQQVARRLADLARLQKASVVDQGVAGLGDTVAVAAALPSLGELDLTDNLIADWGFATGLLTALPSLSTLNLSRNRLELPTSLHWGPVPAAATQLPTLATLVLNSCGIGWAQAVAVAQQLPNLRELHLVGNSISALRVPAPHTAVHSSDTSEGQEGKPHIAPSSGSLHSRSSRSDHSEQHLLAAAFGRLEVLDLEGNQLADWDDVQLLCMLPALRSLLLSGNQLPHVQYREGFTTLTSLLLGRNCIADWASVDQMDFFPALTETRLTGNPILEKLGSSGRYEVIARMGKLAALNASTVTKMERWDAELNYLRHVTDELAAAKDEASRQHIKASHPRLPALTARYGQLAPSGPAVPAGGASLARGLVEVVMSYSGKEVKKKLPVSLTVGKLKLMIEKLLRVKVAQQALLLVLPPAAAEGQAGAQPPEPEDITDEDARELRYFNPVDGTRVEVSECDPAARAAVLQAAKQAAAERHQQLMQEHDKMIQQFRSVEERLMA
ncbi:hypothetical protein N2152v2_005637 [Parachlorella kessleri]